MGVSQRLQSAINSIIGDPQANDDLVALLNAAEGGTITSLGLAMPSIFTVLNSPITSSGTIGVVSNTQLANVIYAGPASGSAATPTFRAFNNNDLPSSISLTSNVSSPTITLTGSSGANLTWNVDGSGDIGALAANRPNNIYALSKIIATAGLGVGNSVAATTPGSVVASIEIFDASGASLGFIPVYDSIS